MGLDATVKPYLVKTYPNAFKPAPNPGPTGFDKVIIDIAQHTMSIRRDGYLSTGEEFYQKLAGRIRRYWQIEDPHDEDTMDAFHEQVSTVVFSLDTPGMPIIKGIEQTRRDKGVAVLTKDEYNVAVLDYRHKTGVFLPRIIHDGKLPLTESRGWRTALFRFHLTQYLTRKFALEFPVPEGKRLVIDEGILHDEPAFSAVRAQIADEYGFTTPSLTLGPNFRKITVSPAEPGDDYEMFVTPPVTPEALGDLYEIESIMARSIDAFYSCMTVHSGNCVTNGPRMSRGEFDSKAFTHVPRDGTGSYLIETQDSDLMMYAILFIEAHRETFKGELWLDMIQPRKDAKSTHFRYVHANELHRLVREEFAQYSSVKRPIETFVYLILLMKNDFVERTSNVTNIKVVMETFKRCHEEIGTLVNVAPGSPGLKHIYKDCEWCVGLDMQAAYRLYLRLQEPRVITLCRQLKCPYKVRLGSFALPTSGRTAEIYQTAAYLGHVFKFIAEKRAERRLHLRAAPGALINIPDASGEAFQSHRPAVVYEEKYQTKTIETLIAKYATPDALEPADLTFNVRQRVDEDRHQRAVLWTLNYFANPSACAFAEYGWRARKADADAFSHWGWDVDVLEDTPETTDAYEIARASLVYAQDRKPDGTLVYLRAVRCGHVTL